MKIRTKLIVNYSVLTIFILVFFSIIVVVSYIRYRQHDFDIRLHNRALSKVNLLLNVDNIDSTFLGLIDRNTITNMEDLQITINDQDHHAIFSNTILNHQDKVKAKKFFSSGIIKSIGLGYKTISFTHVKNGHSYLVKASAIDNIGINELKSLLNIITWVLGISVLIIILFGFYNAYWSLKPFKKVIKEVENIEPANFKKRVTVKSNDEISQLANAFNKLLDRIEQAFESEKSFISNASHELRTPVTSIMGQIEVVLNKSRNVEEYKNLLQSVYEDTALMANIINGFLELSEINLVNDQIPMTPVRIDELIFTIIDDFNKRKPQYNINVEFITNPEADTQLICLANFRLLRLMFRNLIDNACKYSSDKKAKIAIDFTSDIIKIIVTDFGIGIPKEELTNVFKPLYRGSNTSGKPGHGIGLAIVKRIADLHEASIDIKSEINIGTTITMILKK